MPSNTARSAGTIYPIVSNIPVIFESFPDKNPRKLGSYLTWVAIAATSVTSSIFLTALALNLLAVDLIAKDSNHTILWGEWASKMIPLMIPLFLITPWLAYVVYPPRQKTSPEAPAWATKDLKKIGSISSKELLMGGFAVLALLGWIFDKAFGIHSTTVAISVVALLVLKKVLNGMTL